MIRIVLADDHRIFREGLKRLLADNTEFVLAGEAANGIEAVQLIKEQRPDVAILDLSMPGLSGIEVIEQVLAAGVPTRCILLTMNDEIGTVRRALRAGVRSYILKESAYDQLAQAIATVAAGRMYLGDWQGDPRLFSPAESHLTQREQEVLGAVIRGESSRQIAEALGLSVRTVETHRQNIMNKLGVRTAVALANYAREHGLT